MSSLFSRCSPMKTIANFFLCEQYFLNIILTLYKEWIYEKCCGKLIMTVKSRKLTATKSNWFTVFDRKEIIHLIVDFLKKIVES